MPKAKAEKTFSTSNVSGTKEGRPKAKVVDLAKYRKKGLPRKLANRKPSKCESTAPIDPDYLQILKEHFQLEDGAWNW